MVKISENEPLPSHTKLRYSECYAKVILESCFPSKFHNLCLQDCPDLFDEKNNIGIEVTDARTSKMQEANNAWVQACRTSGMQKEKWIKVMEKSGECYNGEVQSWLHQKNCIDDVINAFKSKLNKLNEGKYKKCISYELFIDSEIFIWDERDLFNILQRLQKETKEKVAKGGSNVLYYSNVYLVCINGISQFDILANTYQKTPFHNQYDCANKASEIVVNGETNE